MIPTYFGDLHQMPPPTFRFQHGMKIRIVDGAFFDSEKNHFFYIFQTVTYSRLKRKLKRINLVKLIIFYHLCSYLCTQIYNQKGIFYVLIRIIL